MDFTRSDPPGDLPDSAWQRQCWDELHEIELLFLKGKENPLTDQEVDRLADLASFQAHWAVRLDSMVTLKSSKASNDSSRRSRLIAIFEQHLDDSHPDVRIKSAEGLASLKAREKLPQILARIKAECSSSELRCLVRALEEFCRDMSEPALAGVPGIRRAVPILIPLLRERGDTDRAEESGRRDVAFVLGQMGPEARQAVAALRQAFLEAQERSDALQREGRSLLSRGPLGKQGTLSDVIRHALDLIEPDSVKR